MILAGIDEAGLGPYLGPLVTASAALEVPDGWAPERPWRELAAAVAETCGRGESRPVVADSKLAYASGGAAALELTVAAFCGCLGGRPIPRVSHSGGQPPPAGMYPWHSGRIDPFPLHHDVARTATAARDLAACMAGAGTAAAAIEAALLHPAEMNRLYDSGLNKNAVLLRETGSHLEALVGRFAVSGLVVVVDKQGGRNDYRPFLSRLFPGAWIETLAQGKESSYRVQLDGGTAVVLFRPRADRLSFATALASMVAKYVRERAMLELNEWFSARIPGLRPTAGYPVDARRWLAETEGFIDAEGLDWNLVKRKR